MTTLKTTAFKSRDTYGLGINLQSSSIHFGTQYSNGGSHCIAWHGQHHGLEYTSTCRN